MEHDVDEVARRLDRFPNFAVETSSALNYLMGQSREKVRAFFTRYQDRILYGADISGGMIPTRYLIDMSRVNDRWTPAEVASEKQTLLERYRSDIAYYATDQEIARPNYIARGLALPESILRKVFYENAVRWIPGIGVGGTTV
jgi:predicted TIM-barrel fold metal-dependent hydrolase